jgi:hypothetical protein
MENDSVEPAASALESKCRCGKADSGAEPEGAVGISRMVNEPVNRGRPGLGKAVSGCVQAVVDTRDSIFRSIGL